MSNLIRNEIVKLNDELDRMEEEAKKVCIEPENIFGYDETVLRLHFLKMKIGELELDEDFMESCFFKYGWD